MGARLTYRRFVLFRLSAEPFPNFLFRQTWFFVPDIFFRRLVNLGQFLLRRFDPSRRFLSDVTRNIAEEDCSVAD
jgi:hypothetical protein